jgi:5-methylcytosine-specific restriction endonuclease McrA
MSGTAVGVAKVAAGRLGMTYEAYTERVAAGERWCYACVRWKATGEFHVDRSRGSARAARCRVCRSGRASKRRLDRVASCLSDKARTADIRAGRSCSRLLRLVLAAAWHAGVRRYQAGQRWCRECQRWLESAEVHGGVCRKHANADARRRYLLDPNYRDRRRDHVRSRKRGVWKLSRELAESILDRLGPQCAYCGGPMECWDHVVPIKHGGQTALYNLVPCCNSCNSRKRDKPLFAWLPMHKVSDLLTDYLVDGYLQYDEPYWEALVA